MFDVLRWILGWFNFKVLSCTCHIIYTHCKTHLCTPLCVCVSFVYICCNIQYWVSACSALSSLQKRQKGATAILGNITEKFKETIYVCGRTRKDEHTVKMCIKFKKEVIRNVFLLKKILKNLKKNNKKIK